MAKDKGKLQFEKGQSGPTINTKTSATSRMSRSQSKRISSVSAASYRKSLAWRGGGGDGFKVPKYQNSYRLEPHMPFRFEVSDAILAETMTKVFTNIAYNLESSVTICREAAATILDRLYKTDFDRVKYIVMITMVENTNQSFASAHGRLWDVDRDTYSVFMVEQPTFYAYGTVHAINYE